MGKPWDYKNETNKHKKPVLEEYNELNVNFVNAKDEDELELSKTTKGRVIVKQLNNAEPYKK